MKNLLIAILLIASVLIACTPDGGAQKFYLGTYTKEESKGIYQFELKEDGNMVSLGLKAEVANPSFLAFDASKRFLIAVKEENKEGQVESYKITAAGLEVINSSSSGGAHPCHIKVNRSNQVVAANYSGGNVAWLRVDNEGRLSDLEHVSQHEGTGPTNRQKGPHAHSAWFVGDEVIAVDLGTDELWVYNQQKELKQKVKLAAGAGPRHLTTHPGSGSLYVVNELNNTVTRVVHNEGVWKVKESITTLPSDFKGNSSCADIHVSEDGQFVYASNRGHNSIAIFKVEDNGQLKAIGHESVRGDHPRNFAISPDGEFLLVANKNTNNIVSFKRNKTSGLLSFVNEIKTPEPVCILFE